MESNVQPNVPSTLTSPVLTLPVASVSPSTNWSKFILFVLLGLAVIAISVFVFVKIGKSQGVKFIGIITEINNGCWSDGVCSIKVDDKWITAEIGGLQTPNSKIQIRGNLIGISFGQDTNKYMGKKVEVYAKQSENDKYYSIYGNSYYYIKLLE